MPQGVYFTFVVRIGLLALLGAMISFFYGVSMAYVSCLGFFVAVFPDFCFAKKLFQYRGARAARKIATSFYTGEALKLTLTGGLFAVIFIFLPMPHPAVFFVAFILAQMSAWVAFKIVHF
jgi:ATP synthase protein I